MADMPMAFLEMIKSDIQRIEERLKAQDNEKNLELFREIDGRYQACVKDWYKGLWGANADGTVFYYHHLFDDPDSIIDNLKMVKAKLETYQYQMNAVSLPEPPSTQVNVTTNVGINISFEQIRSQVEEMTSITPEQTQEAIDKINEIEEIVKSSYNKKTKWEKLKPILKWIADKSCDLGIALLPLILKI